MVNKKILGMDIGGTNLRMGLVDETLSVSCLEVIPARQAYQSDNTPEALSAVIKDYINRHQDGGRPLMIAAGFPSVVDKSRRRLYSSTNFPGLDGVDIVGTLEDSLGIPAIIDHDAYYLLAYDIRQFHLPSSGAVTGFYFGTGMGNAIYINGMPFTGKNGAAAEVGHIQTGLSSRPCSCGNKGCIEMYCCGKALEQLQGTCFADTDISELFTKWGGYPGIRRIRPVHVRAGGCGNKYPGPGGSCHRRRDCPDEGVPQGKAGSVYIGACTETLPRRQSGNLLFSAFAEEWDYRCRNRGI